MYNWIAFCTLEMNTTLLIHYTPMENKKFKKPDSCLRGWLASLPQGVSSRWFRVLRASSPDAFPGVYTG